ncbi:MAG: hypothetical protein M3186_14885 [Actinomycetota bacterium]|nr:hypothetical protein [Actinomycetota bacterium]
MGTTGPGAAGEHRRLLRQALADIKNVAQQRVGRLVLLRISGLWGRRSGSGWAGAGTPGVMLGCGGARRGLS